MAFLKPPKESQPEKKTEQYYFDIDWSKYPEAWAKFYRGVEWWVSTDGISKTDQTYTYTYDSKWGY